MKSEDVISKKSSKKDKRKEDRKEYWHCCIGPVKRSEVPYGGDFPLRQEVKNIFFEMFPDVEDYTCGSGWGNSEEKTELLSYFNQYSEIELSKALKYLQKESKKRNKQ